MDYAYGNGCYAGQPSTITGGFYEFVLCTEGGKEKHFILNENEIVDNGLYYFNCVLDRTIVEISATPPHIEGKVLTIYCVPYDKSKTQLVKIDIDAEKVISTEVVSNAKGLTDRPKGM